MPISQDQMVPCMIKFRWYVFFKVRFISFEQISIHSMLTTFQNLDEIGEFKATINILVQ